MLRTTTILLALLVMVQVGTAQNRYFTKTGTINFNAGTPVEDVDGINKSVTSVFDVTTGQIQFAVLIKGFEFKRGLMQEHFNENYMESDKFPKSTFSGKFVDLSKVNFKKDGTYPVTVTGTLEMHGVKKEVQEAASIRVTSGNVLSEATFKIQLADFKIEIPGAVKDKISPTVEIHVTCDYKAM